MRPSALVGQSLKWVHLWAFDIFLSVRILCDVEAKTHNYFFVFLVSILSLNLFDCVVVIMRKMLISSKPLHFFNMVYYMNEQCHRRSEWMGFYKRIYTSK